MFKEGDKVPTFSIITDKKEFILKEINTYKTVVFFFPKANTSGCTREAVEFSHLIKEFKKLNYMVASFRSSAGARLGKCGESLRMGSTSRQLAGCLAEGGSGHAMRFANELMLDN